MNAKVIIANTKQFQLDCLRSFMQEHGYHLVYTDRSVYFEGTQNPAMLRCSFARAVRMYNAGLGPRPWIKRVNLQRSGNEIQCTSHFLKFNDPAPHTTLPLLP